MTKKLICFGSEGESLAFREFKHVTCLSHVQRPEVNISCASTVVSQIFKQILTSSKTILKNVTVVV